jgi:hypothetical protein
MIEKGDRRHLAPHLQASLLLHNITSRVHHRLRTKGILLKGKNM